MLSQPTRFEIDGTRYYRTGDKPDVAFPSVTAILGRTASAKSKQSLATWALKNPGGREAAAERGTAIHAACEAYIRGQQVDILPDYLPFWEGMARHLDKFDYFVWSEAPLRPEWKHCTGEDGISRIWSHKYRYCGCPDLIGFRRGISFLLDFKTSVGPYCRYFPTEPKDRNRFGGWQKFQKTCLQLGAYSQAAAETLGVPIEAGEILVTTPETTQSFLIRGDELNQSRYRFFQRVKQYYELEEAEAGAALEESKTKPIAVSTVAC